MSIQALTLPTVLIVAGFFFIVFGLLNHFPMRFLGIVISEAEPPKFTAFQRLVVTLIGIVSFVAAFAIYDSGRPSPPIATLAPTEVGILSTNTPTLTPTVTTMPSPTVLIPTSSPTASLTPGVTPTPTLVPTSTPVPVIPYLGVLFAANFDDKRAEDFNYMNARDQERWQIRDAGSNNMAYCVDIMDDWTGILFGSPSWKDYSLQYRAKFTDMDLKRVHDYATLNAWVRLQRSPWDGYAATMSLDHNFVQVLTGSGNLAAPSYILGKNTWYLLRVDVSKDSLRYFVDGQLVVTITAGAFSQGMIAIDASPGIGVCVDDIVVRNLDNSPQSMTLVQFAQMKGQLTSGTSNTSLYLQPDITSPEISKIALGDNVLIADWNSEKTWALVRQDRTGIQGWLPAEQITLLSAN